MSSNGLRVEALTKIYGSFMALREISLEVSPNSIHYLVGPNGAGKSTLLKLLAGIARPDNGRITLNGGSLLDAITHSMVRYLPERVSLHRTMSGRQNLKLFASLYGGRYEDQLSVCNRLGLTPWIDRRVDSYSKGTLQKLGLCIALLGSPKLILLDEPFDGLDPSATYAAQKCLLDKKSEGTAIVISSHRIDDVMGIADDYAFIRAGEIVESGCLQDAKRFKVSFFTNDPVQAHLLIEENGWEGFCATPALEDLKRRYIDLFDAEAG